MLLFYVLLLGVSAWFCVLNLGCRLCLSYGGFCDCFVLLMFGAVGGYGGFVWVLGWLDLRGICVVVMLCGWGVCGYYARFEGGFDVAYCCCVVFCFCFVMFVVSCLFCSSGLPYSV